MVRYAPPECASEVVLGHIAFKIYTKLILNFVGCTTREGSAFLIFKCPTIPHESGNAGEMSQRLTDIKDLKKLL